MTVISLFSRQIFHLNPQSIQVPADRQRSFVENDKFIELKDDIEKQGIMNPLIVRADPKDPEAPILVAGFNRLAAAKALNLTDVPARFLESLDTRTAKIVELSENLKRSDLPWRDHVRSIGEIHKLFKEENPSWTIAATAKEISMRPPWTSQILNVYANLDSPRLAGANSIRQAMGILERFAERRTSAIIGELVGESKALFAPAVSGEGEMPSTPATPEKLTMPDDLKRVSGFNPPPLALDLATAPAEPPPQPKPPAKSPEDAPRILVDNFLTWAEAYTGAPFNFVHCDFPYGVNTADSLTDSYENNPKIYWDLLDCLVEYSQKLLSYSSHLLFWLSLRWQDETKKRLQKIKGIHIIDRPIIWLKTDMRGAAPGVRGTQPRHVYEAALLCSRGGRPLVKQISDGYPCHSVSNPIHPTQKPETMLKHFFAGLIDETTDMFDPTAGSGASIRAAEELGAKSVLGLELDPNYAAAANMATQRARNLRKIGGNFSV